VIELVGNLMCHGGVKAAVTIEGCIILGLAVTLIKGFVRVKAGLNAEGLL
jgi:hypothetical protein